MSRGVRPHRHRVYREYQENELVNGFVGGLIFLSIGLLFGVFAWGAGKLSVALWFVYGGVAFFLVFVFLGWLLARFSGGLYTDEGGAE